MNKKGFTLMELLGVIIILSLLSTIAILGVTKMVKNSKESLSETQIESIRLAAETWGAENITKLPDDGKCMYITLETLKNLAILDDSIYNITNNEKISDELKIKITTSSDKFNNLKYTYEVNVEDNEASECELWTPICVRATSLHEETCTRTSSGCYDAGYTADNKGTTISYGSLGTVGKLNSGDAFDCDVNGDGTYASETERFYYITDLDNNTAVLIYYNNYYNGAPNNTANSLIAYNSSGANNLGPVTAVANLPTKTQWSNVSLSNSLRQITNELGNTTTTAGNIVQFNYSTYNTAARFLTAQELNIACTIKVGSIVTGELDNCNYLMENTQYSSGSKGVYAYWLETPRTTTNNITWAVHGFYRYVATHAANSGSYTGVRPVIEVPKTLIVY